jgi:hypothetical protein
MAEIDMVPEGLPMGRNAEGAVQSGGGGSIDMFGTSLPMSHYPVSSVQKGGSASIDMIGEAGLLNSRTPQYPYGQIRFPADKGE